MAPGSGQPPSGVALVGGKDSVPALPHFDTLQGDLFHFGAIGEDEARFG